MGDALHNKKIDNSDAISVRNHSSTNYICPFCEGYYSKKNLRRHVKLYCPNAQNMNKKNYTKTAQIKTFKVLNASPELLNDILPSIKNNELLQIICNDDIIVEYGNRLVRKLYKSSSHHNKFIAQQLRFAARILQTMKEVNKTIKCISDVFYPCEYLNVIETVHRLARWKDGKYEAPTTANQACILIQHFAEFVRCRSIMNNDKIRSESIQDFIYLMQKNQNADITKVANVNRVEIQRGKIEDLPSTKEINLLICDLEENIIKNYNLLHEEFNLDVYCKLTQLTLAYILVFNRKRPGDCERTLIKDYENIMGINEDSYNALPKEQQRHAKQFMRFIAQGKLNKKAANLISLQVKGAIDLLLLNRKKAQINITNVFLPILEEKI